MKERFSYVKILYRISNHEWLIVVRKTQIFVFFYFLKRAHGVKVMMLKF